MARPKGSAHLLEQRRRQALALLETGLSFSETARRMHCAPSSVMRWFRAWQRAGSDSVKVRKPPGRPTKLGAAQRRRLADLLLQGAAAHGYPAGVWTTSRVADMIEREYGVRYHPDHIGRLMRGLGWCRQGKPPAWVPDSSKQSA